ncbi:MAG: hypothetical protein O2V44_08470, partial [Candidatus Bathyarchaeota archaeon]|nr:hypothetical protein [Candidatus Bathyarchaeota archaeon]
GMLAGYIAGAWMTRFRMKGSTGLKSMFLAAILAAIVAIVFTTQTYIWYSPMFEMGIDGMNTTDAITFNYFVYTVIFGVWTIIGTIIAKVSTWFR